MGRQKYDYKILLAAAKDLGQSTYMLGTATGMPQATVSKILRGEVVPGAERLKKLCDVLDLDINDVFITDEVKAAA